MSKKSSHRHVSDTPFVQMSKEGAQRAFDKSAASSLIPLLDAARRFEDQELQVAALVLSRPGKPDAIVFAVLEYGDGEGKAQIENDLRICKELSLLTPGEALSLHLFTFDGILDDWKRRAVPPVPESGRV